MFLRQTVEDIVKNRETETEVIVVLDGKWSDPPLPQMENVNVIYVGKSIGQRAATNLACKLSHAKYVMKADAHCSFDKGFDRKMIEAFQKTGDNVTMVPVMRNLHAFDWKCYKCGWKKDQGPTPEKCPVCGRTHRIHRKMIWEPRRGTRNYSYSFNSEPHFQYFGEYKTRPETQKSIEETGFSETMCLQGSCFMLTRDKYWELSICDDSLGNWGNQGIEVSCKTWLSGGRVLVNHNTWYAHMFRTQGGDFGFPYDVSGRETQRTKENVKNLLWKNKFDKQIYPVSWLVDKFWPVNGWTQESLDQLKESEKSS